MKTGVIKKLWSYAAKYRFAFILSLVTSAVYVGGSLYLPILFGKAADMIIGVGEVDLDGILHIGLIAAVVAVGSGLMQWIAETACVVISDGITRSVRNDLFDKMQKLPLSYIDGRPSGDILSVEIGDVDRLADGLLLGFSRFFSGVLTILGTLAFMISINPFIALAVACLRPCRCSPQNT